MMFPRRPDYSHLIDPVSWALLDTWRAWLKGDKGVKGYAERATYATSGGINCWDDLEEEVDGRIAVKVDVVMDDLLRANPRYAYALRAEMLGEAVRFRGDPIEIVPLASAEFLRRAIKAGIVV